MSRSQWCLCWGCGVGEAGTGRNLLWKFLWLDVGGDYEGVCICKEVVKLHTSDECALCTLFCNKKVKAGGGRAGGAFKRASEILISSFKPLCSFFSKNEEGPHGLRFLQDPRGF